LLSVRNLQKEYVMLRGEEWISIEVLRGVDLEVSAGEMLALTGASGSGKSTLLNILGALDSPTGGEVFFDGQDLAALDEQRMDAFRRERVGFVFQGHHLLPDFSALENVMMPSLIRRDTSSVARGRALELLELVGLGDRVDHRPGELSGGEQQRVAIARALCLRPSLLLADEPTGNLDNETAANIHRLLRELNARLGITAVVVTHNEQWAGEAPRRLRLSEGRVA
jgi:lipoprotein-releasing system ATP-binding protein